MTLQTFTDWLADRLTHGIAHKPKRAPERRPAGRRCATGLASSPSVVRGMVRVACNAAAGEFVVALEPAE